MENLSTPFNSKLQLDVLNINLVQLRRKYQRILVYPCVKIESNFIVILLQVFWIFFIHYPFYIASCSLSRSFMIGSKGQDYLCHGLISSDKKKC